MTWANGVCVAIALTVVSCGGGTPDGQEEKGATNDPMAPLAVEWTDAELERDASRIGYGSKPEAILTRDAAGVLIFTPQTAQDHVATPFTNLAPHDGGRSLDLVLDVTSPGGEACVAHLQDQAYNVLGTVPCRSTGEQRATIQVPPPVSGVRVYFLSANLEPLRLPARMRLTERR